jgi:hypothetical protein
MNIRTKKVKGIALGGDRSVGMNNSQRVAGNPTAIELVLPREREVTMLRATLCVSVAVLTMLSTVGQAWAAPLLVNQTTGATIFDDNFEGGVALQDPVATVGTWTSSTLNENTVVQGPTGSWGGSPAANEGSQLVGFWAGPYTTYLLGDGIAANSGVGDVVKMQIAYRVKAGAEVGLYTKGGVDDLLQIGLWGPDASAAYPDKVNNGLYVVENGQWLNTGLAQDPNAWNVLTVTHKNGTATWDLSLNGSASYTATGFPQVSGKAWTGFLLYNDAVNVNAYFDAVTTVPEPSSFALLGPALVGLMAYAWRKR